MCVIVSVMLSHTWRRRSKFKVSIKVYFNLLLWVETLADTAQGQEEKQLEKPEKQAD